MSDRFHLYVCDSYFSRLCPEWLDVSLLVPGQDADAGHHVDVLRAVWGWSSDRHLLCSVRRSRQAQRGILRRLPTRHSATFCKRRWCGEETLGGERETGETGLMQTQGTGFSLVIYRVPAALWHPHLTTFMVFMLNWMFFVHFHIRVQLNIYLFLYILKKQKWFVFFFTFTNKSPDFTLFCFWSGETHLFT